MIGFYDYTVVLTYVSAIISMVGMTLAVSGYSKLSILFLAASGLCDMFDGKIARTKKNRTEEAKRFGIQIDSLCDIICFGIFPIIICYTLGIKDPIGVMILMFYGVAGVIRLAWFNVREEIRQTETTENRKYYQGLPITSMSIALPIAYMLRPFFDDITFFMILRGMMLIIGLLFIADIRVKKPTNRQIVCIVVIVAIALLIMFTKQWRRLKVGI